MIKTRLHQILTSLMFALVICMAASPASAQLAQDHDQAPQANWLDDARWGTMSHYLYDWLSRDRSGGWGGQVLTPDRVVPGPMSPENWSKLIDAFDVEALADQLADIGVDYHVFTVTQTSGYYASPNAAYDRIVGRDAEASWFPERDLIADLGDALHERGIRLIVYIPHEPAIRGDAEATEKLRPTGQPHPEHGRPMTDDEAWRIFAGHWEEVVGEYAQRWGDRVDGWWFDGCWFGQLQYEDAPNADSLLAVLKDANPEAIVSFNHQFRNLRGLEPPAEDYFAGETNAPHQHVITSARFGERNISGQMLVFLGHMWYFSNEPRYTQEQLVPIARRLLHHGGIVTWDVPIRADGTLVESFLPHLRTINQVADENPIGLWRERTDGRLVPEGNLAYKRPAYAVSLGEAHGHHGHFPHVLPASNPGNLGPRTAEQGVDGDPDTYAQASEEWPWSYYVDLQELHEIDRIEATFDPQRYPTHLHVMTSTDGAHWQTLHEYEDHDGSAITIQLDAPHETRWVRLDALKPDGPDQPGAQMAVGELRVHRSAETE